MYEMVAPALLEFAGLSGPPSDGKDDPIMQARAVACLGAAWPHPPPLAPSAPYPGKKDGSDNTAAAIETDIARREAVHNVQRTHAGTLTRTLSGALRRKVWSVRVPIFHALAAVVSRTYVLPVSAAGSGQALAAASNATPVLTGSLLADAVQAVELGAEDAKYSQVRLFSL